MALVLPLLLLVIMGIIDFGFLFREFNVVTNAAREGARAGVLPDYADDDVRARVQQYMDASGMNVDCADGSAECVVTVDDLELAGPSGNFDALDVRVIVFHQFSFLGPIATLTGGSFTSVALTGRSVMRLEAGS